MQSILMYLTLTLKHVTNAEKRDILPEIAYYYSALDSKEQIMKEDRVRKNGEEKNKKENKKENKTESRAKDGRVKDNRYKKELQATNPQHSKFILYRLFKIKMHFQLIRSRQFLLYLKEPTIIKKIKPEN